MRRGRGQRVDGREDAVLGDRALQRDRRVEVGEGRRRRRVGVVVGGHVDRLQRGDRAALGRGDALLELAHLGGQRRLVADGARHAAEQRRHFGAGLREAEDVVDEEQHVAASRRGSTRPSSAPVRPTRRRAPGGSFIWPKTMHRLVDARPTRSSRGRGRCPRGCARPRRRRPSSRRARRRCCGSAPG